MKFTIFRPYPVMISPDVNIYFVLCPLPAVTWIPWRPWLGLNILQTIQPSLVKFYLALEKLQECELMVTPLPSLKVKCFIMLDAMPISACWHPIVQKVILKKGVRSVLGATAPAWTLPRTRTTTCATIAVQPLPRASGCGIAIPATSRGAAAATPWLLPMSSPSAEGVPVGHFRTEEQ